jgi:hypothetical protein
VTGNGPGDRGSTTDIDKSFSLLNIAKTSFGVHSTFYQMGTENSFTRVKAGTRLQILKEPENMQLPKRLYDIVLQSLAVLVDLTYL